MADHSVITREYARKVGLKRYFTGKPCPRGHLSERLVSTRGCLACAVVATQRWAAANDEKFKATKRANRVRNAASVAIQRRVWNKANAAKVAVHKKAHYRRHKHAIRLKNEAWLASHPEAARAMARRWARENSEMVNAKTQRYRARLAAAPGSFTGKEVIALYERQAGLCPLCRVSLAKGFHMDHIMPLFLGGSNFIENIQLLCPPCNQRKGWRHPSLYPG